MLDIQGVAVSYGMHRALGGVDVHVGADEIVVILGANGAGKSSLLKAVAGTCEGDVTGQIVLDGEDITRLPSHKIVERGIAYVPEGRGIFGDLEVIENLRLGAYTERARRDADANLARVLDLFPKLVERRSQIARTMSGGEQQMVAIGRALMASPQILMLDEPSLGLSPKLCKELFQLLLHVRDSGVGILLVEQNAKRSLAIADRGYLIENGAIRGENDAASLANDPEVQAAYLGGSTSVSARATRIGPTQSFDPNLAFIEPAQPRVQADTTRQAANTDALIGEGLDSLLARASNAAAQPAPASTQSANVPDPSQPLRATDDPNVAALLDSLETAARNAQTAPTGHRRRTPNRLEQTEPEVLPTIPMFRKSRVDVYRRNQAGALTKVESQ